MRLTKLIIGLVLLFSFTAVSADDSKKGINDVVYVTLEPGIVTNYGGPGRLKYLRADITLMATTLDDQVILEKETPLIRNTLVFSLSRQPENNVATPAGQERMRQQLLQDVQEALIREVGQPIVLEVLFTSFIFEN